MQDLILNIILIALSFSIGMIWGYAICLFKVKETIRKIDKEERLNNG